MGPKAIDRMLELEPPREQLDSLAAVWRDFQWRRLARGHRDPCISYTASSEDLRTAIQRACDSRGSDGKLFFHQGRVWQVNRDQFRRALASRPICRELSRCDSFHSIWSICSTVGGSTFGIGSITSYDVSARLSAWAGFPARRLYLHGGVIDGANSVGLRTTGRDWIERRELPRAIRYHVNLDEVEDFLCGYRVLIERAINGP